mmetsp:Transcript_11697/g.8536  ORF Transcript_11697/g.8536 Transcript_11697/m.8536 type:complete len:157 (+) Transcript_11697:1580-2050(+)
MVLFPIKLSDSFLVKKKKKVKIAKDKRGGSQGKASRYAFESQGDLYQEDEVAKPSIDFKSFSSEKNLPNSSSGQRSQSKIGLGFSVKNGSVDFLNYEDNSINDYPRKESELQPKGSYTSSGLFNTGPQYRINRSVMSEQTFNDDGSSQRHESFFNR